MSINFAKLQQIQTEISEWSSRNFGSRRISKVDGSVQGSLQPLLGLGEELGELMAAEDDDARNDAVADFGVYLSDYCNLEGVSLSGILESTKAVKTLIPIHYLTQAYGQLLHCTLKRHQGIRGFDDAAKYREARDAAIGSMGAYLLCYCANESIDFMKVFLKTWERVQKRDWEKHKLNADKMVVVHEEETDAKELEVQKIERKDNGVECGIRKQ